MKRTKTVSYALILAVSLISYYWSKSGEPGASLPVIQDTNAEQSAADTAKATIKTSFAGTVHPTIFEAVFRAGTTAIQGEDSLKFTVSSIGKLKSESGVLIACDPINIGATDGFAQQFPTGNFPVELAMAHFSNDERVAFSRIVFGNGPVAKWQLAALPGHKPLALDDSITYCYPVDSGTGIFADVVASNSFHTKGKVHWDDVFLTKAEQNNYRGFIHSFNGHNLATFSTGLGDGCYSTYIGYDSSGKVCRLLTDFRLLNWQ